MTTQRNQHTAISINPSTGDEIERFSGHSDDEVEQLLTSASKAFEQWRAHTVDQRAAILQNMASTLKERVDVLASTITREMGKTLTEAQAEVLKCATACEWYAEHGPALIADERAPVDEREAYVSYLPIGAILGVMPWNFPLWQAMRAAVPILLGGNVFVLKPAPNVMRCSMLLQDAWNHSGLPVGVMTTLNISNEKVDQIVNDSRIAGVTVTGSVRAGAAMASAAGQCIKKSVLELGGADPYIVLADADLTRAVETGITARFQNAGQVCLAAKQFILERPIADAFIERFVEAARKLVVGDPFDESTNCGPLARGDLRDTLNEQVKSSVAAGATLLLGGTKSDGPGYFYPATVLSSVRPGMPAFDEETFGPVATMTVAKDEDEAVTLANTSEYGLSSNIWTADINRARRIARRLETGGVFINGYTRSDPRVPVGGSKKSGYGRELSHFGIKEFLNAQTVWIESQ